METTTATTQYYQMYALTLLENGYEPIPITPGLKYPRGLSNWQNVEITPDQINEWLSNGFADAGVGIRTAWTPAVDIDVNDEDVVRQTIKLVEEVTGCQYQLQRVGMPPKSLLPFRTDQKFSKLTSPKYRSPDGREHKLEILADGQQFVAYADHPDTKNPYKWNGPFELRDFRQGDLPLLTLEMAQEIIRRFTTEIVPKDWKQVSRTNPPDTSRTNLIGGEDPFACIGRRGEFTIEDLRSDLAVLDPNMTRDGGWLAVGMGTYHQFAGTDYEEEAKSVYDGWSQGGANYKPGEINRIWISFKHDPNRGKKPITYATVRKMADEVRRKQAAVIMPATGEILLPSGPTTYIESALDIFTRMAEAKAAYFRGGKVCEVVEDRNGRSHLEVLTQEAFKSRIEKLGQTKAYTKGAHGGYSLALKRPSVEHCRGIMETTAAREILPKIENVFAVPLLVLSDGKPTLLTKGYNPQGGGAFVCGGEMIPDIPVGEAAKALNGLLCDFRHSTPADYTRHLSLLLSPALRFGGFINGPCPMHCNEADQSQTGKGYANDVVASIYGERPAIATQKNGGVGSFDESISQLLIGGNPFVQLDNLRGRLDSQFLEAILTAPGTIGCRVPHQGEIYIDPRRTFFLATSNGFESTIDLANRCCIIRLLKQIPGYRFKIWPEGDLVQHAKANQAYYLGCIHAVIRAWYADGVKREPVAGHDFREWASTVQAVIRFAWPGAAPLLEGHREAQVRTANSSLTWLRTVCIEVLKEAPFNPPMTATDIARLCIDQGIEIPGIRDGSDLDTSKKRVGQILGNLMRESDPFYFDQFTVTRSQKEQKRSDGQGYTPVTFYNFGSKTTMTTSTTSATVRGTTIQENVTFS